MLLKGSIIGEGRKRKVEGRGGEGKSGERREGSTKNEYFIIDESGSMVFADRSIGSTKFDELIRLQIVHQQGRVIVH